MKNIYTQEMKDRGELPKVGMTVLIGEHEMVILLEADSDGCFILKNNGGAYVFIPSNAINPIDTRTDKEKAIEDVFGGFTGGSGVMELLGIAYDKWVGNNEK